MSDLLGAIAGRNQAIAQPQAAHYAAANRLYVITLVRPGVEPKFDRRAGAFISEPQPLVYSGPARIYPVTPGMSVELGEGPTYWSDVQITIGLGATMVPRIDDLATIGANTIANTARVTGKVFRVTAVALGGQLATGFALTCTGVTASRYAPNEP